MIAYLPLKKQIAIPQPLIKMLIIKEVFVMGSTIVLRGLGIFYDV